MIDSVAHLVLRALLSLLLASAALHKWRDLARFRAAVLEYALLPAFAAPVVAAALAAVESVLSVTIALGVALPASAMAGTALMLVYAGAIYANVRRGRTDIDCGCLGPAARVPLSSGLVARNLALASAFTVLAAPIAARALSWLDAFVAIATTLTLAACWQAAQNMLALAPRVASLRRPGRAGTRHAGLEQARSPMGRRREER